MYLMYLPPGPDTAIAIKSSFAPSEEAGCMCSADKVVREAMAAEHAVTLIDQVTAIRRPPPSAACATGRVPVGWVERSDTHHFNMRVYPHD